MANTREKRCLCFYFIQGQQGESLDELNVFEIPGMQKISDACLRDVLANFPLKGTGGTYHFRFRIADPVAECGFVWMDLTDPSARLPIFRDVIIAKLLQLDKLPPQPRCSRLRMKPILSRAKSPPSAAHISTFAPPVYGHTQVSSPLRSPDSKSPSPTSQRSRSTSRPQRGRPHTVQKGLDRYRARSTSPAHDVDLMQPESEAPPHSTSVSPKQTPHLAESDLLDFGKEAPSKGGAECPVSPFFTSTSSSVQGQKSQYVQKMMMERKEKLQSDTRRAIQFKKKLDASAVKEQEDADAAKARLGPNLTAWSEDHGQKRNVRTLLCTMHTVLWEGSRWKQQSMGDIIAPDKVKVAYRKAMLIVHPDKCADAGADNKFISNHIFQALNEAYVRDMDSELQ
eukprot:480953_1